MASIFESLINPYPVGMMPLRTGGGGIPWAGVRQLGQRIFAGAGVGTPFAGGTNLEGAGGLARLAELLKARETGADPSSRPATNATKFSPEMLRALKEAEMDRNQKAMENFRRADQETLDKMREVPRPGMKPPAPPMPVPDFIRKEAEADRMRPRFADEDINLALMAGGLEMLGNGSPNLAQAISAGGKAALNAAMGSRSARAEREMAAREQGRKEKQTDALTDYYQAQGDAANKQVLVAAMKLMRPDLKEVRVAGDGRVYNVYENGKTEYAGIKDKDGQIKQLLENPKDPILEAITTTIMRDPLAGTTEEVLKKIFQTYNAVKSAQNTIGKTSDLDEVDEIIGVEE